MADKVKRGPGRPKTVTTAQVTDAVNTEMSDAENPTSVTLSHPYAYYAEDGLLRAWAAGTVVTDPADIADLVARKAPLKG